MKYLFEFAKIRNILKTKSDYLKNKYVDKDFIDDGELLDSIYLSEYDKTIKINWFNNKSHSIIKRLKDRTTFISTTEFNSIIEYGLKQVFPSEIGVGIKESGRYALHFNNNRFYLVISLNYKRIFDDDFDLFVVTVTPNTKEEDIIEIYGD